MKINSIKFKLSILHTLILGIILAVFSGALYIVSTSFFIQIDKQLTSKAEAVDFALRSYLDIYKDEPDAVLRAAQKTVGMKNEGILSARLRETSQGWVKQSQTMSLDKDYINIFAKGGKLIASSPNMDRNLSDLFLSDTQMPKGLKAKFKTLNYKHRNIRIITYSLEGSAKVQYFVQVGVSQDPFTQELRNWTYAIVVILPLILFLTIYFASKQVEEILGTVHEITQMANKITHQDLSARIKAKSFDSEMGSLVESFNEMIARLEKSFKHTEEFSHHVAHELKTPLTIIKGEADLLLRKERSKHEYQQALRIVLEESERLLRTIEDMLLLAKLDYQPEVFNFEEFDFIEFFNEICEQTQMLAAPKAIGVIMRVGNFDSPLMIKGDRLHLRRLFFNLLDNAIKFTPQGGVINIKIDAQENKIITSITDSGPGIPPAEITMIFEKFFRTHSGIVGSGLGLSIAWAIAKVHNGDISVESHPGQGAVFKVVLPVSA